MTEKKIILTEDGSNTIYSNKFQSTYHSTHGAIQESKHVFIKHGLDYYHNKNNKQIISILEYGFGTGLNAILTLQYCISNSVNIDYIGLEAYPLSQDEYKKLNYLQALKSLESQDFFDLMHSKEQYLNKKIHKHFTFSKEKIKFENFSSDKKFDIIYFDAFSPDIQNHLWERPFLDKVVSFLNQNGVFITYGAKGTFKRALKSLGLEIENPPGPPGKREITRGVR